LFMTGPGDENGREAPGDTRVGSILADRYRISALLGEGGMGKVYAAEHVLMRKRLAVKVLHRELTTVPEVVKRFEREAMAAANIEHPNVAAATDFGKLQDGSVFLVLEYVQGRNLRDVIADGPMPVGRSLHVARQIASALASAHALKIVHRDLKPENVMLVEKAGDADFVKVLDFGIAKVPIGDVSESGRPPGPGSAITKVGMVFGTPEYMAPEQALGQVVDGRADLYALGVMLYEMIAGTRPFVSQSSVGILGQQLAKPVPRFHERAPGLPVPDVVEELVLRMLEREAAERFQLADDVVSSIDAIVGAPPRTGRRPQRSEGSLTDLRLTRGALGEREEVVSIPEIDSSALKTAMPTALPLAGLGRAAAGGDPALPRWDVDSALQGGMSGASALGTPPIGSPVAPTAPSARAQLARTPGATSLLDRFRAKTQPLTARARMQVTGRVAAATHWIDESRQRWPDRVSKPLAGFSARTLLAAACLVMFLLVTVAAVAVGSLSWGSESAPTVADAPAPSTAAVPAKPTLAQLEQATRDKPTDPAAWLALAEERMRRGSAAAATQSITQALNADPKLAEDIRVQQLLRDAVRRKDGASAFPVLETQMGARGADIIYELALATDVEPALRQRAEAWLNSAAFQKNSSAELNAAVALRHAKSCQQRRGLLLRVKNVGDARSLPYLKQWESRTGCGPRRNKDCHACLRSDALLQDAARAISERTKR
jgi:serine/threonine-protein kinase